MQVTLECGKQINILDTVIERSMKLLEITEKEAIDLYLSDNDLVDDEELDKLDEKAKKVKIVHGAKGDKQKSEEKDPRKVQVKVSDQKKAIFNLLKEQLTDYSAQNEGIVQIITDNKLIVVKIGEQSFKIDLIEQRKPKKPAN